MSLYFLLMLGTITGPFFLSFDKKVAFYKNWKALFLAISPVALGFILWDIYFTENSVWGFNPAYLQGIYISNLPLEECLFFILVPYACVFIYEVMNAYFPQWKVQSMAHYFAIVFTIIGLILPFVFWGKWYTMAAPFLASIWTIWFYFIKKVSWYSRFALAFWVATIPFLLVNGALTGSFTPEPIVWYSDIHIMGPRMFTIPVEDVFYNYSMLFPIMSIYEWIKKRS